MQTERTRETQLLKKMENRIENNRMEQVKITLWALFRAFDGIRKNEDVALFVALLLYLRRKNALHTISNTDIVENITDNQLSISPFILKYNEEIIENENNIELKGLLEKTLSAFDDCFKGKMPQAIDFAHILLNNTFSEEELLYILDLAIENSYVMRGVFYAHSHELSELVEFLLNKDAKNIFDPFGGLMYFATKMKDRSFEAYENNLYTRDLAFFRMGIAGVLDNCSYVCTSPENWPETERFQAIITVPPFGRTVRMEYGKVVIEENAELVSLRRFYDTTQEDGQLITVVPQSFLFSEQKRIQKLREEITKNNWLDAIICLPNNIFSPFTSVSTAVVVLKKQRENSTPVKLVDASSCFTGKERYQFVIDVESIKKLLQNKQYEFTKNDILEQQSNWSVQWYLETRNAVFSEGYTVVKVSDVIETVELRRRFNDTKGRIVNVTSLSSDVYQYEKGVGDFPESNDLKGTAKVTEPVLLLSLIGSPKPTFCNASVDTPIFLKSDVCAYRITNKTVFVGYLCLELSKRLKATKGVIIPRLSKTLILSTRIELPSLDGQRSLIEQKNIVEEARITAELGKVKVGFFEDLLEKRKNEYIEEVRNRKHDMTTPIMQLKHTLPLLERLSGAITEEVSDKFMLYISRLKEATQTLSETVIHLADEDVFANPEPINLGEVLSSYVTTTERYVVAYYPDEAVLEEAGLKKPMVLMGKSDLLRLVGNIVGNAINHGFKGDGHDYSLNIGLTIKDDFYVVDFSNNGKPLPDGMTRERYGMKGVKGKDSDGEGRGGNIVKNITEHYGGDYDVFLQRFAGVDFTHVIVKLPIYRIENE